MLWGMLLSDLKHDYVRTLSGELARLTAEKNSGICISRWKPKR